MGNISVKDFILKVKITDDQGNKTEKTILKGINADFEPGTVNAILAPNGSGKSTFLNALFGRINPNMKVSGEVYFNGKERNLKDWIEEVSYVEQCDYAFEDQTVLDAIIFAQSINIKEPLTEEHFKDRLKVMEALNLMHLQDKNINAISGGEKKRVMIAVELLMKKKVLILDEPTSDLDSYLAYQLLEFLKKRAKEDDLIVLMTIHQPSDQIFNLLDNVMFIHEGKQVYWGKRSEFENFLESQGISKPDQDNWSISEFAFEILYGSSNRFKYLKSQRDNMMESIIEKSNDKMKDANPIKMGSKSFFDFRFCFHKFHLLTKRFILMMFNSKVFYFKLAVLIIPLLLIKILVSVFALKFSKYKILQNILSLFNIDIQAILANPEPLYRILNSLYCSFVSIIPISLFYIDSGVMRMKNQLAVEISKAYYNTFTLFVSFVTIELFFTSIVAVSIFTIMFIYNPTEALHYSKYTDLMGLFVIFGFSKILYFSILYMLQHCPIITSCATFLKYFDDFLPKLVLFLSKTKKRGIMGVFIFILRYICIPLVFLLSTSSFYYNVINYFENLEKNEKKNITISKKILFFTGSIIDYRWNYLFIFLSFTLVLLVSFLIFSFILNPNLSVKNVPKNRKQFEDSPYDRLISKIHRNRKKILIWTLAIATIGIISIMTFTKLKKSDGIRNLISSKNDN